MADPICRWRNATPETVCEIIEALPKREISEEEFRKVMSKSNFGSDFFHTPYQLACQLALYYIDDNHIYHPRFFENITKEAADEYLHHWFRLYYIPNPYTKKGFDNLSKPQYFEKSLFESLQKRNVSTNFSDLLNKTFKDEIGELDILKNLINRYSDLLKIENNKISIKIKDAENMEINVDRNDRESFFNSFNKKSSEISYPYNRIIFGAPGTGKSYRLENQRKKFFDEGIEPTQAQIIASEIQDAGNNYGSCFAIGLKYSEFFNGKKPKNLKSEYNCSNDAAYTICQGMRAKDFYASLPNYKTEELSEQKIKLQLEKLKNEKYMNQAGCAAIGLKYSNFLQGNSISDISNMFDLSLTSSLATWIYYGTQAADYTFDETSVQKSFKHYERVTFHPNYSYSQFVGCYKPKMKSVQTVDGEKEEIIYSFVPGPFLRVYVNAIRNSGENFLLLIEEINRANVAAVFGDVFQLLDRRDGKSEYPVTAGEDIIKYLESEGIKQSELSIPKNMFIWATMNSADQGVFPMDTAFKRRWNFEYIGIDENESGVSDYAIPISRIVNEKKIIKKVKWNDLRHAINTKLISMNVNEDKLLGPYFIGEKDLEDAMQNQEDFIKLFKSKVLMYLFEDAAKMKRNFFNCEKYIYSEICKEFDEKGIEVFNFSDEEKGELKELDISQTPETSEPALE